MRILVVDDEADTRRMLKQMLAVAGHVVHTASSAMQALVDLRFTTYDLVLLDINMPGMNGHQLAQSMSSHWDTFEVPIIVVSGRADVESKEWSRLHGCVRYIEKPFGMAELYDAVSEVERGGSRPLSPG